MSERGKYRGKRIDNGEEVRGGYCEVENNHYIIPDTASTFTTKITTEHFVLEGMVEVNPKTVGQFTGLKDKKNNAEVYDDDFCLIRVDFSGPDAEKSNCETLRAYMSYDDESFSWCWHSPGKYGGLTELFKEYEFDILEILGNIHDNPELLKVKE